MRLMREILRCAQNDNGSPQILSAAINDRCVKINRIFTLIAWTLAYKYVTVVPGPVNLCVNRVHKARKERASTGQKVSGTDQHEGKNICKHLRMGLFLISRSKPIR